MIDRRKQTKTTPKNFEKRMKVLLGLFEEEKSHKNKEGMQFMCQCFDEMLERMADEDFFGTEMQLDPRGDPR